QHLQRLDTVASMADGGIVNSAVGALFAYYVQSETSQSCAGFPPLVSPASFNMTNATAHLELFNVKHFIARSPQTRKALANSPNWRLRDECQGWSLYELTTHDGSYVFVPELPPMAVRTTRWKEAALHWLYTVEALNQPFVLLHPNDPVPPELPVVLSEEEYERRLEDLKQKGTATHGTRNNRNLSSAISNEMVTDDLISFDTKAVGCPHIVKCTYYPNWKLRDGGPVFMVSPCFMLIYPRSQHVELYYGSTTADNLGRFLTLTGVGLVGAVATKRILRRKTVDEM
ncbi:MAG: hypothetical protein N2255_05605, partial [Kiritimatiellae bacterium]|nr:hypothetical protein [Kiritimatiellia bacterium]